MGDKRKRQASWTVLAHEEGQSTGLEQAPNIQLSSRGLQRKLENPNKYLNVLYLEISQNPGCADGTGERQSKDRFHSHRLTIGHHCTREGNSQC